MTAFAYSTIDLASAEIGNFPPDLAVAVLGLPMIEVVYSLACNIL